MGIRGVGAVVGAVVITAIVPMAVPDARGDAPSGLPVVASGARPGPDVLYADAPDEPQLQNRDPRFAAEPLLVSGTEAYRGGEYLYQDYLYDDNGSDTGSEDAGGSDTAGDVSYPDDRARLGGNAADLVELRIAPGVDSVAYRFSLNTLLAADAPIVSLAFDTDRDASTGGSTLPRDPGFAFPGTDELITTWGTGAEHTRMGDGVTTAVDVVTDLEANQLTVTVPRSVSDPRGVWDATVVAGVHDVATGGWLRPDAGPMDAEPTGVFNIGFRFDELPRGITPHDSKQAAALRAKTPGAYKHPIDFAVLDAGTDVGGPPATGTMVRIFPSRLDLGEGKDYDDTPELYGRLQSYSVYVPTTYDGSTAAPLMLDLHSLGEHHWQYNGSTGVQQIGEERGAIVISCECRGEDGWYQHEAEYDVFEMWNDAARQYRIDPDHVGITGYSMGGYATYRLGTLYPDLFGKALSIVGPPTSGIWLPPTSVGHNETLTNLWLDNARNLPFLNAVAGADELVPIAGTRAQNLGAPESGIRGFDQLGYRYRFVLYPAAEHLTIAVLGYDLPYQREWLGDTAVDRDPTHVTFRYLPAADDPELGLVHDHAYWISGIEPAVVEDELSNALVDAFTHAHGLGDPTVGPQAQSGGHGPLPYASFERAWGDAPATEVANKLTLKLDNVAEVTIDLRRAGLTLDGLDLEVEMTPGRTIVHLVDGDVTEDRELAFVEGSTSVVAL